MSKHINKPVNDTITYIIAMVILIAILAYAKYYLSGMIKDISDIANAPRSTIHDTNTKALNISEYYVN